MNVTQVQLLDPYVHKFSSQEYMSKYLQIRLGFRDFIWKGFVLEL